MCEDDYNTMRKYIAWKDDWFPFIVDMDTDSDKIVSIDELMVALEVTDTSVIAQIMAFHDVDSSGDISYAEAAA